MVGLPQYTSNAMSDLLNEVVRLAHSNPELRKELLPLVGREVSGSKTAKARVMSSLDEARRALFTMSQSDDKAKSILAKIDAIRKDVKSLK